MFKINVKTNKVVVHFLMDVANGKDKSMVKDILNIHFMIHSLIPSYLSKKVDIFTSV